MKLLAKNTYTRVEDATDEEVAWLDRVLSFPDRRRIIARIGDGRVHLLSSLGRKFPTGLVPTVRAAAREAGVNLEVDSQRERPCEPDRSVDLGWLRPHQREAVEAVWRYTRGIIHHPPAAGKGEVDVAIAASIPCPWLMLVHRAQLAKDVAARFERRTGVRAGFIGDGEWDEGRLTCATFQSMHAALARGDPRAASLVARARGLIVDEVHATPADTFMRVVAACDGAYWRVGLSATPLSRGDMKNLWTEGMIGPVIHKVDPATLIAAGLISAPRIRMVVVIQKSAEPVIPVPAAPPVGDLLGNHAGPLGLAEEGEWRGQEDNQRKWHQVEDALIVESAVRNAALEVVIQACAKPAMIFVSKRRHGQILTRLAEKRGFRAAWMDGSRSVAAREAAATRLRRGDCDFIVCTPIMDTGVDIPELAATINASGGASAISTIQRLGRGARVTSFKRTFEVWDVLDRGQRWLAQHSSKRKRTYEAEGYEVEVVDPFALGVSQQTLL